MESGWWWQKRGLVWFLFDGSMVLNVMLINCEVNACRTSADLCRRWEIMTFLHCWNLSFDAFYQWGSNRACKWGRCVERLSKKQIFADYTLGSPPTQGCHSPPGWWILVLGDPASQPKPSFATRLPGMLGWGLFASQNILVITQVIRDEEMAFWWVCRFAVFNEPILDVNFPASHHS